MNEYSENIRQTFAEGITERNSHISQERYLELLQRLKVQKEKLGIEEKDEFAYMSRESTGKNECNIY